MKTSCTDPDVVIIIQARVESSRFPGKINEQLYENTTLLSFILQRLVVELESHKHPFSLQVYLAMPDTEASRASINLIPPAILSHIHIFYGETCNVLQRYKSLLLECFEAPPTCLVRVCADNPFIDWSMMMEDITRIYDNPSPYKQPYYRGIPSTLTQLGLAYELINSSELLQSSCCASDAEHVTLSLYRDWRNPAATYKLRDLEQSYGLDLGCLRLTIDYSFDLIVAKRILANFSDKVKATTHDILSVAVNSPGIQAAMMYNINNALPKY